MKKKQDLTIKIGGTEFVNPVWVASGTFGSGDEFRDFVDLKKIGAVITKTVTMAARAGNPSPRVVETPSGLLNSIGLENGGITDFKKEILPGLRKTGTRIIASISGSTEMEFADCAAEMNKKPAPDALEINLSCPNVTHKGGKYALFAQDPGMTEKIVKSLKRVTGGTLIVKLTPNVTDIKEIAKAAETGGADAVSLVNTYFGMAVDAGSMRPLLGNITGGLSGPAIKPMALKAVWDVYNAVKIPVIGIGGIMTGTDIAEFMLCGATAVQLGTVNFVDPACYPKILKEFTGYMKRKKITRIKDLVGKLQT